MTDTVSIRLKVVSSTRYEISTQEVEIRASSAQQVREVVHALSNFALQEIPEITGDYELEFYPVCNCQGRTRLCNYHHELRRQQDIKDIEDFLKRRDMI